MVVIYFQFPKGAPFRAIAANHTPLPRGHDISGGEGAISHTGTPVPSHCPARVPRPCACHSGEVIQTFGDTLEEFCHRWSGDTQSWHTCVFLVPAPLWRERGRGPRASVIDLHPWNPGCFAVYWSPVPTVTLDVKTLCCRDYIRRPTAGNPAAKHISLGTTHVTSEGLLPVSSTHYISRFPAVIATDALCHN